MKVKENHWQKAAQENNKDDAPKRTGNQKRQVFSEQLEAAQKFQKTDQKQIKENAKFADLQNFSEKMQKPEQRRKNNGEEKSGSERRNENPRTARETDSAESLTDTKNAEKYENTGGQTGGGQSGFNMDSNVSESNLSENFAARSILHIADLERMVAAIRTQTGLGGRREITLQLKNSVLEGLQVKILTDSAARVQIEFLAANEKVRAEITKHTAELSKILNGRGINLESVKTRLASSDNQESEEITPQINNPAVVSDDELSADNTFNSADKTYKA